LIIFDGFFDKGPIEMAGKGVRKAAFHWKFNTCNLRTVRDQTFSVRRKNYNRIVARLRNYHSLVIFLHSPPINNLAALSQIHSTLSDLEVNLREIELSVDCSYLTTQRYLMIATRWGLGKSKTPSRPWWKCSK
jgi:hypothetical protein